jgi:transposase
MTRPFSVDLRDRVARYVLAGHSRRQAASVFNISVSSAVRYVAQYLASGTVVPKRQGGDRRSKLGDHRAYVLLRVKQVPDISLADLTKELAERGVQIHLSNLARFLRAQGLTYKKNFGRFRADEAGCPVATRGVD